MNPLQSRLAALRSRLRIVITVRGTCLAASVLLGCLLVAGLVDCGIYRLFGLEAWSLLRATLLGVTLCGTGVVVYQALYRPLCRRTDDLSLALRVEEQYPILNDALASTVQFLEQQGEGRVAVSPSLQKEAVQRALRLAQGCDFFKAVNPRGLQWSAAALMLVLVIAVPLVVLRPALARTALARIADPYGDHPWQSTAALTQIEVSYPRYLAYGQVLNVTANLRGELPARASIEFDGGGMGIRTADVKKRDDGTGAAAFQIKLDNPPREIRFRVRAGDAVSPIQPGSWHTVGLRQPPQLVALGGKPSPQIALERPKYTGLPVHVEQPPGTGNIDVLAGTLVSLRGAADRPIARVWVEFQPSVPEWNQTLALAGVGPRPPLDVLFTTTLASSVWGKIPGRIDKAGTEFTVRFLPWVTGAYVLTLEDKDGLAKSYAFDQSVEYDPVPAVDFLRPSTSQSVLANADVTLEVLARDEKFALRSVWLEYRRKDRHGAWIDAEPRKLLFYDHQKSSQGMALLLQAVAGKPMPLLFQPLELRPKFLLLQQRWSLRGLAVEGETLVIQACADDFCDVIAFRQPGRSVEIELKVVGKAALAAVIDEAEAKIQQQILQLRDMQDQAIKKVIGAEQQWRATGKLREDDLVELAKAELLQKDIEERIGAKKDKGLRDEIAQLEQLMKDNKLPSSEVSDRLKVLRQALEKISRDNLPKIEPNLAKARRELEMPEPVEVPSPKDQGDLGTARTEQEKVYQTLDELLRYLEEQSNLQQVKAELRAILKEQQDRQQELDALIELMAAGGGAPAVLRQPQNKAELRKTALLQRRLAERTQKLIDKMDQLSKTVAGKDDGLAEMLEKAANIANTDQVVEEMRDTANVQLKDRFDDNGPLKKAEKDIPPQIHRAREQQGESIKTLEAMLEVLDQGRAAEVEKLGKNLKKEEKNLDDLAARLDKLQAEIAAAKKIADPQAREKALKDLADKQRALVVEVEKKAREFERLQAQDAADHLNEAAKKMERMLKELDEGKAPEDELKLARREIDNAKEKLKDAQDAALEELTREQIAKIVDRLQGLKERQDAAIAESERLHKAVLQAGQWKKALLQSLRDDADVQAGVAKETALLRDKLKGAKVYHMVLDRAVKTMTAAADKIKEHQEIAVQLRDQGKLDDKQVADEARLTNLTLGHQKEASNRLQHLIDALLPELDQPKQDLVKNDDGGKEGDKPPKTGGLKAQDGIPPVAQLKVLKAEQLSVNQRTKDFADQHPNLNNLTRDELAELMAIHAEQDRLLELFREMVTGDHEGGKQP